ncbi:MAG: hypothetical protein CMA05_00520 [Euryarchaeota archaeon]|nr:hypothetical protein [Euryarchaeota archaeon]
MWTQDYDLHSHSTNSDGEHSVDYVAELMARNAVKNWSLTDHDTISGWKDASAAAGKLGINFIPGVEITCECGLSAQEDELELRNRDRGSKSWHLLAYFPNLNLNDQRCSTFADWLRPLQNNRIPRMEKMIEKLGELGMPVEFSEVASKAGGSIGRPHLAEVMVEKGYVESKSGAFELWIGDGLPAHVIQPKPSIQEAVEMVKKCGGITSLAHPIYYGIPPAKLVEYCLENGVDSIEAFHRSHPDDYRFELWQYCKDKSMSVSCGSDFHGESYGQTPGSMAIPIAELCF